MLVPSDAEFVDAFGAIPEAEDEPRIKAVRVEDVLLSFDPGRGFRAVAVSRMSSRSSRTGSWLCASTRPCASTHDTTSP